MIDSSISVVKPDVLNENMLTILSFLRETHSETSTHLQNGFPAFKDGIREIYYQIESHFKIKATPANSLTNDHTQINSGFQQQVANRHNSDNIVPVEIEFISPLEEY